MPGGTPTLDRPATSESSQPRWSNSSRRCRKSRSTPASTITRDLEAHGRVDVFANLLESDIERLHILITRHAKLTGSRKAAEILADWKTWLLKFRKVIPVEYRRALKELKANADAEPKIAIGA